MLLTVGPFRLPFIFKRTAKVILIKINQTASLHLFRVLNPYNEPQCPPISPSGPSNHSSTLACFLHCSVRTKPPLYCSNQLIQSHLKILAFAFPFCLKHSLEQSCHFLLLFNSIQPSFKCLLNEVFLALFLRSLTFITF